LLNLFLAAALCTGCDEGSERVYFGVGAEAEWIKYPTSADALGYTITVGVVQIRRDGVCGSLPAPPRVVIGGYETDLAADPETGCMEGGIVLGPTLKEHAVTVTLEEDGRVTATALFSNLLPGTAATLLGPSEIHPGDDVVVRPVPDVPAEDALAHLYPLDDPVWSPNGIYATTERRSDGLHVQVPAFTGRAVLTVWNTVCDVDAAEASCPGFAVCSARCANALGPFFVTGVP
jgi:hypothetical protein